MIWCLDELVDWSVSKNDFRECEGDHEHLWPPTEMKSEMTLENQTIFDKDDHDFDLYQLFEVPIIVLSLEKRPKSDGSASENTDL